MVALFLLGRRPPWQVTRAHVGAEMAFVFWGQPFAAKQCLVAFAVPANRQDRAEMARLDRLVSLSSPLARRSRPLRRSPRRLGGAPGADDLAGVGLGLEPGGEVRGRADGGELRLEERPEQAGTTVPEVTPARRCSGRPEPSTSRTRVTRAVRAKALSREREPAPLVLVALRDRDPIAHGVSG